MSNPEDTETPPDYNGPGTEWAASGETLAVEENRILQTSHDDVYAGQGGKPEAVEEERALEAVDPSFNRRAGQAAAAGEMEAAVEAMAALDDSGDED